jgi:NAD-dependent deacetylase
MVWFGAVPLERDAIYDALLRADLSVSIGTSGSVYPAAGLLTCNMGLI